MIVCAAIEMPDGTRFKGKTHADAVRFMVEAYEHSKDLIDLDNKKDGFIYMDPNGIMHFLDRTEAAEMAFICGQIKRKVGRLQSYHIENDETYKFITDGLK